MKIHAIVYRCFLRVGRVQGGIHLKVGIAKNLDVENVGYMLNVHNQIQSIVFMLKGVKRDPIFYCKNGYTHESLIRLCLFRR